MNATERIDLPWRSAGTLLILVTFIAASASGQWLPSNALPTDPINRSGSVTIAGIAPWGSVLQYVQLAITPGVLFYGPSAAVHATNMAAGPTVTGVSEAFLGSNYAWWAHGGLTGVQGNVMANSLQTSYQDKIAVLRGGFFEANLANPIPLGSEANGPYQISGVTGQLDGTIGNLPTNGVIAGVFGLDNIANGSSYAGYFQGKGFFTDKVTVIGGALIPASLSVSAPAGTTTALSSFSGNRFNGMGAALEGGQTGVLGLGGFHFTSGNSPSETFGVHGMGTTGTITSTGVHGDAIGSRYAKGVWGTALGANIEGYGVYGEVSSGFGYAGYFNGDVYASGMYLPSDRRLKENIHVMESVRSKLSRLTPITFRYSTSPELADMHLSDQDLPGFDADNVEAVFPALVKSSVHPPKLDEAGNTLVPAVEFKAVNYTSLIPVLVKALQDQDAVIQSLQARIAALEHAAAK